jgi:hypothetical protein
VEGELAAAVRRPAAPLRSRLLPIPSLALSCLLLAAAAAAADDPAPARFHIVLFTCIYERPLLTEFVLRHYAGLAAPLAAEDAVDLDLFITGSDASTTAPLAARVGATHANFPNSPLGAKHNAGLAALRDHYVARGGPPPHAVVIVGSDDLLNRRFFTVARARMTDATRGAPLQLLGLRDLYLYDLAAAASGGRLAHTRGYRRSTDPLAATVGCGRVFSWPLLERLRWTLWDGERDRSLDQSTVRRVADALGGQVAAVAEAVAGAAMGVVAVDVKTGGLVGGRNIWSYDDIVGAGGRKGRLHPFRAVASAPFFDEHFGPGFEADQLRPLLARMLADAGGEGGVERGGWDGWDGAATCAVDGAGEGRREAE